MSSFLAITVTKMLDHNKQIQSLSSLIAHSQDSKKEKTAAPQCRMSSLHNWFFCRPPTRSSIWSKTILLHRYRVFQLPANIPTQSSASISDFRCQPHQRDDALCPFLLYAFPVKKSTKRVKKELSTCAVNSFCCIITLFKLRYNIWVKIRRRPTSPLPLLS